MSNKSLPNPSMESEKWSVLERIGKPIGYIGMVFVQAGRAMSGDYGSSGGFEDGPSRETCRSLGKVVVSIGGTALLAGAALVDHYVFQDAPVLLK